MYDDITIIVIGKNEGRNLPRCFTSIKGLTQNIIYVDSDSSDNSIQIARSFGVKIILSVKGPFLSASLGRYIGSKHIQTKYTQFLDGDMTIDAQWLGVAKNTLEGDSRIAAVLGYKKVYTKNESDYFILSDKKRWEPDYMGGAFLIRTSSYFECGEFDIRLIGEEERDLYVRLRKTNHRVYYIHYLMASHYDFKKTSLRKRLFSNMLVSIWVPMIKSIQNGTIKEYIFVYRYLLFPLICEIATLATIIFAYAGVCKYGLAVQVIEFLYCVIIKRKGYFILWKAGVINFPRLIIMLKRKVTYTVEKIESIEDQRLG